MNPALRKILKGLLREHSSDDLLYELGAIFQANADEAIDADEIQLAECWQKRTDAVNLAARTRTKTR